ncbi:hypothetical protein FRC09_006677 [Ceratobasidium sp. 395]|nr:hypothetical protein FRC09_006677 [Ceratobasidium sp. 395]
MPPIEFDPAFADTETDNEEPVFKFNPETPFNLKKPTCLSQDARRLAHASTHPAPALADLDPRPGPLCHPGAIVPAYPSLRAPVQIIALAPLE